MDKARTTPVTELAGRGQLGAAVLRTDLLTPLTGSSCLTVNHIDPRLLLDLIIIKDHLNSLSMSSTYTTPVEPDRKAIQDFSDAYARFLDLDWIARVDTSSQQAFMVEAHNRMRLSTWNVKDAVASVFLREHLDKLLSSSKRASARLVNAPNSGHLTNIPIVLLASAATRWSTTPFTTPQAPQAELVQWLKKDSARALDMKVHVFHVFIARLSVLGEMPSDQPGEEVDGVLGLVQDALSLYIDVSLAEWSAGSAGTLPLPYPPAMEQFAAANARDVLKTTYVRIIDTIAYSPGRDTANRPYVQWRSFTRAEGLSEAWKTFAATMTLFFDIGESKGGADVFYSLKQGFKPGRSCATRLNGPAQLAALGPCLTDTSPLKLCSGCSAVVYCGIDHQRQDWIQRHKLACAKKS